jgi:hypothetical protein
MTVPGDWVPDVCILPTAERPLRIAELDELFTRVLRVDRATPTSLHLVLPRAAEFTARDLTDRESQCCSFFVFGFETDGDDVMMRIEVPPSHQDVLDALEARIPL